ncbi:ParB/RepB/Spo0J family partition protein [Streptomyces sp. CB02115]|uniref:ParB/RepB/Spo0J family partition protein n=1 Tax=Streptomyces sp. CB02115 TaxID=1703939 RepID=UPI0009394A70|nr:ParB/RepB/Spo0J family partition protein [Streptomyces sp. CB02115]
MTETTNTNKIEFVNLKISEIAPNPEQPRKFFSEEAQEELTNSIKANGLLQPVVVRPVDGAKAPYMLIAGERRWRSCQAAGLEVIPAKLVEGATEEEAYVLSIAENVNRADMTIMEEAGAYADLKAAGWEPAKIAKQFGKTETHITWRLGLLTLRPEVSEMVDQGAIKSNLAWHIAQLSPSNQMVAAMRYVRGDFDSESDAQHFANGLKMMESQTSLTNEKAPTVEEKEKQKKAKAKTNDRLGKVEEDLIPLLEELVGMKPEDLAVILGDDLPRNLRVVTRLHAKVQLAKNLLSKAQGIQRAKEEAFAKAAVEVQLEAAKKADTKKPEAAKPEAAKPAAKPAPRARAAAKAGPTAKPAAKPTESAKPAVRRAPAKKADAAAK